MKVEVINRHRSKRVSHNLVCRIISICGKKVSLKAPVVSVVFLENSEMSSINEVYTGRSGATDVLSFPLGFDAATKKWYYEILISLDRARLQAREKDVSLANEVVRLLVHAVVHLAGYDHYSVSSFKKMRRLEFGLLLKCLSA